MESAKASAREGQEVGDERDHGGEGEARSVTRQPARLLSRTTRFSGRRLRLDEETIELPNGERTTLEMIRHPGAAAIVALTESHEVLLVRQFRHAANGWIYELPAGTLDAGEAPAGCAARELIEETGYRAGDLRPLGSVWTTPGFTDEVIHLYLATQLTYVGQELDQDELLEVVRVPSKEAIAMMQDGRISDGKSIAALMRAAPHW